MEEKGRVGIKRCKNEQDVHMEGKKQQRQMVQKEVCSKDGLNFLFFRFKISLSLHHVPELRETLQIAHSLPKA